MNYIKEFLEFICEATEAKAMTRVDFIKMAKAKWNNLYDYSQVTSQEHFKGMNEPVRIICKKHGPFNRSPKEHILLGLGCPDCTASKSFDRTVNQIGYVPGTAEDDPATGKGDPFYTSQHKSGRKLTHHKVGGGRSK